MSTKINYRLLETLDDSKVSELARLLANGIADCLPKGYTDDRMVVYFTEHAKEALVLRPVPINIEDAVVSAILSHFHAGTLPHEYRDQMVVKATEVFATYFDKLDMLTEVKLLEVDTVLPSGHLYPRAEVERVLSDPRFMKRVEVSGLLGEIGSPKRHVLETDDDFQRRLCTVDLRNAGFSIDKVQLREDGVVMGTVRPICEVTKKLMPEISELQFGMRSIFRAREVDGHIEPEPGSLQIITFDCINSK